MEFFDFFLVLSILFSFLAIWVTILFFIFLLWFILILFTIFLLIIFNSLKFFFLFCCNLFFWFLPFLFNFITFRFLLFLLSIQCTESIFLFCNNFNFLFLTLFFFFFDWFRFGWFIKFISKFSKLFFLGISKFWIVYILFTFLKKWLFDFSSSFKISEEIEKEINVKFGFSYKSKRLKKFQYSLKNNIGINMRNFFKNFDEINGNSISFNFITFEQ